LKDIKLTNQISLINKKFKKKEFYHYFKTSNLSLVIAKIKNKYILVSQKRVPINKINYEFPSGIVEKNETTLRSAQKELTEETGYKSRSKLIKMITFYTEPGRLTTKITGYYTKNLIKISKPEKGIKVHLLSQNDIFKLILKQKFNNSSHIAMFLYLIRNHKNF
jgi:8-oxo-dGTP pyrophosphatase MutT (NUDIX family)|tara:strand:+ start:42 stop:533 length:492 start_codon:yes stop_codon:yes gene_type:complete